jgi:hypothetical protein
MKVRPRLYHGELCGGVYFAGPRSRFLVRGWQPLPALVDACLPLLRAGTTEEDLVRAFGTEQARPAVRYLLTGLRAHGMLLDLDSLSVGEPGAEVRARYARSILELESAVEDPYAAFAALRTTGVLVAGPPDAIGATMKVLTGAGIGRLVVPSDVGSGVPAGVDVAISFVRAVEPTDDLQRLVAAVPVVPAVLDSRVLIAGPVLRTAEAVERWDAFRRHAVTSNEAAHDGAYAAHDAVHDARSRPTAGAFVGSLAARVLVDTLTGLAADGTALVVPGSGLVADRVVLAADDHAWRSRAEVRVVSGPQRDVVRLARRHERDLVP